MTKYSPYSVAFSPKFYDSLTLAFAFLPERILSWSWGTSFKGTIFSSTVNRVTYNCSLENLEKEREMLSFSILIKSKNEIMNIQEHSPSSFLTFFLSKLIIQPLVLFQWSALMSQIQWCMWIFLKMKGVSKMGHFTTIC